MQNQINAVSNMSAAVPPKVLTLCDNVADFAFDWGSWFIIVALFVAVGLAVVEAIVRLRPPVGKPEGAGEAEGLSKMLEGLKGVLEALAKLPVWVALFLAGFALLWLALEAPKKCPNPIETSKPAPPAGETAAANTAAANTTK